jgi:hypothetical protein
MFFTSSRFHCKSYAFRWLVADCFSFCLYFRQCYRGKGPAFVHISVHGVQIMTRELCGENWCGMLYITYKINKPEFTFSWHFVNTLQFWLKSGNNYGHFTGRRACVFAYFIRLTTVSNVSCRGKWKVFYVKYTFLLCVLFSRYLNKTRACISCIDGSAVIL